MMMRISDLVNHDDICLTRQQQDAVVQTAPHQNNLAHHQIQSQSQSHHHQQQQRQFLPSITSTLLLPRATKTVVVFVKRSTNESEQVHQIVIEGSSVTLHRIAQQIQLLFGIARANQTITALKSPELEVFEVGEFCPSQAEAVVFADNLAFRVVEKSQSVCWNQHLKTGRRMQPPTQSVAQSSQPSESNLLQDKIRTMFTQLVTDSSKHISLAMISKMTTRSKSSLSLWRRGCYSGNNLAIAQSVAQAIEVLRNNDFHYDPTIHDGCLAPTQQ